MVSGVKGRLTEPSGECAKNERVVTLGLTQALRFGFSWSAQAAMPVSYSPLDDLHDETRRG